MGKYKCKKTKGSTQISAYPYFVFIIVSGFYRVSQAWLFLAEIIASETPLGSEKEKH